jgi:hypothetical protein
VDADKAPEFVEADDGILASLLVDADKAPGFVEADDGIVASLFVDADNAPSFGCFSSEFCWTSTRSGGCDFSKEFSILAFRCADDRGKLPASYTLVCMCCSMDQKIRPGL